MPYELSPDEYAPFYADYVKQVADLSPADELARQLATVPATFLRFSDEQALYRYEAGKWSLKEVLGHLTDSERIFAARALRMARGDKTPLPGFDQNTYIGPAHFDQRSLVDLMDEFRAVRMATLALLRSLGAEELQRRGTASGATVSVRALFVIMAGHVRHHLAIVQQRYLPGMQ
ncbi:MAG: DinB family protein [Bacteroidetes bacterium]|nr:MAG: DinB family protein [Bacteroidota bacterium]